MAWVFFQFFPLEMGRISETVFMVFWARLRNRLQIYKQHFIFDYESESNLFATNSLIWSQLGFKRPFFRFQTLDLDELGDLFLMHCKPN